ncbi:MAG: hypothetical protein AB7S26_28155 [Sandaracinaceae bacterium]
MEPPEEILVRVLATVRETIETPELGRFALARGEVPQQDAMRAGADAVLEVYRADTSAEAARVLGYLEEQLRDDPKRGEVAPGEGTRVYVALWAMESIAH